MGKFDHSLGPSLRSLRLLGVLCMYGEQDQLNTLAKWCSTAGNRRWAIAAGFMQPAYVLYGQLCRVAWRAQ